MRVVELVIKIRISKSWASSFESLGTRENIIEMYLFSIGDVKKITGRKKLALKYYSPMNTHGKTFIYNFWVL